MEQRHLGLTKAIADSYTEAARVCLDRHHNPPADFFLHRGATRLEAFTQWSLTDERTRRAWSNETDATEDGAYALALAAVDLMDDMVAVHRAETKTGADYYISPKDSQSDDLENSFRLEVSGVDRGTEATVMQRLREKLGQAARGNSNLPAVASVVGFRTRVIMMAELEA